PEDFFILQASMYGIYHMKDPEVFYNKEDLWSFPKEKYAGQTVTMQPYYTIMRLPGESREEFMLMLPMVPRNRDNMIAWRAARRATSAPEPARCRRLSAWSLPPAIASSWQRLFRACWLPSSPRRGDSRPLSPPGPRGRGGRAQANRLLRAPIRRPLAFIVARS